MKNNVYATLSAAALLLCSNAQGQVAFGGEPWGLKAEKIGLAPAPVAEMPAVDAAALLAEDAVNMAHGNKGPYRFGFNHSVDLSTENNGVWSVLADGTRIWRLAVHCPGAYSINFVLGEYVVPQGGRVFVFNDAHQFLGGFTAASNPGHTELGVTQLAGERITIEYQEPASVAGQGHLRITQVTHAYRDILHQAKGFGDSGSCNNNVICPEGDPWRDQIAAVAMITVGGSGLCTGTLINNCANDGTPYFLTANHCTQGGNVGTWSFRFNWESPSCTPTANGPTNQTVSGSTLLVNNGGSDVALLQLNTTPPSNYNVYYSGWDATGTTPLNQTCIHHPSGDIKKISFDYNSATQGNFGSAQCWHILNWDDGTTEPESSGSCLLNQDKRIIGQLFGGAANCTNNVDDFFGRFDISFPLLQNWLGGSCGQTLDGYDPNFNPVALDAAVQSINDVDDNYCNQTSFNPTVTIKNLGTTTLTSVTLLWHLDGGSNTSVNWSGSLATGATATVGLGYITFGNGPHTLTVASSAPNGGTDLNTGNDVRTKDFSVASPGQGESPINITLDDYGSETSWTLETDGGTPVASGGPYSDGTGGSTVTETVCIGDGCYDLTMLDSYGDGFCCAFGNGDYEVVDAYGHVYVNGDANFTYQVITSFCLTNTGVVEPSANEGIDVFPNPANGLLTVVLPNNGGRNTLIIRDALGREVFRTATTLTSTTMDLGTLPEGTYSLEAVGEHARSVRRVTIQH